MGECSSHYVWLSDFMELFLDAMQSAHVSVHASHRSEVSERTLMDRVSAASGSKKV